jgi:hypothetical protein
MLGDNPDVGINVARSSGLRAVNNEIGGQPAPGLGIFLYESSLCEVMNNAVRARWQGILVGFGQSQNKLVSNDIRDVQNAGLSFEGNNLGNQVTANRVWFAPGGSLNVIDVGSNTDFYKQNKVQANKLMQ